MKLRSCENLLLVLCTVQLRCVTVAAVLLHVSGYENTHVNVSCPYHRGYESNHKYLCRDRCGDADVLIESTRVRNGRYSIHDDTTHRVFTTTISNLSLRDTGTYWCGVSKPGLDYYPAEVKLQVVPDSCCAQSTKLQTNEKNSMSISFSYDSGYEEKLKYICRGNRPSTCLQRAVVTSDSEHTGQFTLTDDEASRTFTVTFTSLTQTDAGSYLCGIHGDNNPDVFFAIELEVKVFPTTTETVSSTQTRSEPTEDALLFNPVVFVVPAVVLLVLAVSLVILYKHSRVKMQGRGGEVHGETTTAENAEGEMDIYENQAVVARANQRTSKQQKAFHQHDAAGGDQQDSVYQNFDSTERVYCNQHDIKGNRG